MTTSSVLTIITGATGNIGSRLASNLLSKGKKVRVVGRNKSKLKNFIDKGAEAAVVNLENAEETAEAFKGAGAVFAMIPPKYSAPDMRAYQNASGEVIAKAIQSSGAKHVVHLSSFGAHLSKGTGPILGLHDQEKRLNKIPGLNIVHLRPAYFMENLFINMTLIRNNGIMGAPLKAQAKLPMIATKDIAAVAADLLSTLDFSGITTRELLGPKDTSMEEVTKIFAKALGKRDLKYIEFPYEDAEKAMTQMGMSTDSARNMVELNKAINEGNLQAEEKRSASNTTPTTMEEFAQLFAEIFSEANKVGAAH